MKPDNELKQLLAKMLPEEDREIVSHKELLYLCSLVESRLNEDKFGWRDYLEALESVCRTDGWEIMTEREKKAIVHATWQQKTMALAVAWGLI